MNDKDYRRKWLAKIHIAKKELGLSDDEYQDIIRQISGSKSAGDLTDSQLHDLLDRFHALGWRPRFRRRQTRPLPSMVWKARALWLELHAMGVVKNPDWTALARFCKRMTGAQDLRQLDVRQGTIVIEALKSWLQREKVRKNSAGA